MAICIDANRAWLSRGYRSDSRRKASEAGGTFAQELAILLHGITADDYLTWVRDPEPHALGRDLIGITAEADPITDRLEVQLIWDHTPPDPCTAVSAAGFAITPEVVAVVTADSNKSGSRSTGGMTGDLADASGRICSDRLHRTPEEITCTTQTFT